MASHAAKAKRRAEALDNLQRLSSLIAKHFEMPQPSVLPVNHVDPELGQIQQVESINALLRDVLEKTGMDTEAEILGSMKKAELLQKAAEKGVDVPKSAKKADIIEALENSE